MRKFIRGLAISNTIASSCHYSGLFCLSEKHDVMDAYVLTKYYVQSVCRKAGEITIAKEHCQITMWQEMLCGFMLWMSPIVSVIHTNVFGVLWQEMLCGFMLWMGPMVSVIHTNVFGVLWQEMLCGFMLWMPQMGPIATVIHIHVWM